MIDQLESVGKYGRSSGADNRFPLLYKMFWADPPEYLWYQQLLTQKKVRLKQFDHHHSQKGFRGR